MTLLTFFRTSVGGISCFLLFAQLTVAASPPPNDNWSEATVIPSLPYTSPPQSVVAATLEPNESVRSCGGTGGSDSVWYRYTPTTDQEVAFETFGSNYDTVLSVWMGTNHPLTELGCNDDNAGHSSFVHLFLSTGTTYYINIASYSGTEESSSLVLNVSPLLPAGNDNFANAINITTLPYTSANPYPWQAQTLETNEVPPSCATEGYASVWYQYTPTRNQTVLFDTDAPVLSVWTGTTHPLTELACNNSMSSGFYTLVLDLMAGTPYYINLGLPDSSEGTRVLNANELTPASNNDLANATPITTLPYESKQQLQWATAEELEATASCDWEGQHNSVWYQYTPTTDQVIALEQTILEESGFASYQRSMTVSVWNGTSHPLTELSCYNFVGYDNTPFLLKLTAGTTYYLKVTTESSGVLNFSLSVSPVTPPTNDNLAQATVISALPYSNTSQEMFGSTFEEQELWSNCGENSGSVWYQYTPSQNQAVAFSFQSEWSSILSVWTGTTHPLTELTCLNSGDMLKLTAGTTYFIKVSVPSNQKSLVSLEATEVILPGNDDLANATVISALPYSLSQSAQWATVEPGEVNEFNYEPNAGGCGEGYFIYGFGYSVRYQYTFSVWYQYTPDHDQLVEFDTLGSSYDTVLSIWTGTAHPLTALTCNDNEYGGVLSQANLKLTAHTTYYIKVGSRMSLYDGDNGGILNFYAQEIFPPSNDHLDQAIPITALPYTHLQNTQGASLETEEVMASCAKSETGMSVWYTYTPTTSQTVILDTQTSSYDTVLSVWTGHSHPLTEIACHDDLSTTDLQSKLRVALTAGTTYLINVSSVQSDSYLPLSPGNLVLTVTANDLELSPLGTANMIDALGNPVTSSTEFLGGISVNGSAYQAQVVENLADEVEVWGKMEVDPSQVGQTAELVVYASYKSSASVPEEYFYMVDNRYSIYVWDQNPANLMALQKVTLAPEQWQAIYRGRFQVPGVLDLFWGYRLADGTVVTNSQGLRVTINRQVNQY